jgi:hypothetical protein
MRRAFGNRWGSIKMFMAIQSHFLMDSTYTIATMGTSDGRYFAKLRVRVRGAAFEQTTEIIPQNSDMPSMEDVVTALKKRINDL